MDPKLAKIEQDVRDLENTVNQLYTTMYSQLGQISQIEKRLRTAVFQFAKLATEADLATSKKGKKTEPPKTPPGKPPAKVKKQPTKKPRKKKDGVKPTDAAKPT